MHTMENIMRVLSEEGIAFTQVDEPEHVSYGFGKGKWLQIDGGCKEAPLYIEFSEYNKVFDLHFGRYSYELFEYSEEGLLSELMNNIMPSWREKRILSGRGKQTPANGIRMLAIMLLLEKMTMILRSIMQRSNASSIRVTCSAVFLRDELLMPSTAGTLTARSPADPAVLFFLCMPVVINPVLR